MVCTHLGLGPQDFWIFFVPTIACMVLGAYLSGKAAGRIEDFDRGIAIGVGLARELGVGVGDRLQLVAPDGARTGITPGA